MDSKHKNHLDEDTIHLNTSLLQEIEQNCDQEGNLLSCVSVTQIMSHYDNYTFHVKLSLFSPQKLCEMGPN